MKPEPDTLRTSWTQIARLKDLDGQETWREFYQRYRPLIMGVAMKAGLRGQEAEEVLQDTMKSVSQHIGTFEANPARGPFRLWLLNMVQWRIRDQFDKRLPVGESRVASAEAATTTSTLDRMPDPREGDLERLCDAEWQKWFKNQAFKELQLAARAEHYQIFHLLVIEEKPVALVAAMVGRNRAQVYLIKHRMVKALERIVTRLEKELG